MYFSNRLVDSYSDVLDMRISVTCDSPGLIVNKPEHACPKHCMRV